MDFAKSDIQAMLLDTAERLLSATSGVEYWRAQRAAPLGFDPARWAQFAELGWLAMSMPEEAGGLDATMEDVALLNVALGAALASEPYVSTALLAGHIVQKSANATLLSEIAAGNTRIAVAHQEDGAHPLAVEAVRCLARQVGNGYLLSGAKMLVLDAPSADYLIVSARVEGQDGVALFLVPAAQQGMTSASFRLIDGSCASDLRFDDTALPAAALLVGTGQGANVLREAIDRASIALMAQAVGAMEAANRICGSYVRERKQFGVAIGSFQTIQHMLADMFVAAHQSRSMLYHALANAGEDTGTRAAALSAARIVIGEAGQLIARTGIQVHGGYGLTDEYAIGHYFRRLMCLEKLYGDLNAHVARFGEILFAQGRTVSSDR